MKKIMSKIRKIFHHIGLFFDKWLITPITKLILKIMGIFKDNAKSIDRIAGKKSTLIIVGIADKIIPPKIIIFSQPFLFKHFTNLFKNGLKIYTAT